VKKLYSNTRDYTIKKGCPWYESQQAFGPPNLNLCERSSCTYLDEPVNTLSNLPVILVGLILLKIFKSTFLKIYGFIAISVGTASFVYHATNNGLTQYIDFLGMFLLTSFLLNFNLLRASGKKADVVGTSFVLVYFLHITTLLPVYFLEMPIQYTVLGGVLPIVVLDTYSGFKENSLSLYKFALLAVLFFTVAQIFAIVDAHKIYCDSSNIFFHGHVFWHLFAALGTFLYGFHMKEILAFAKKGEH